MWLCSTYNIEKLARHLSDWRMITAGKERAKDTLQLERGHLHKTSRSSAALDLTTAVTRHFYKKECCPEGALKKKKKKLTELNSTRCTEKSQTVTEGSRHQQSKHITDFTFCPEVHPKH